MYGAKWLLASCLAAVSVLTLLIPISCKAAEPDEFPWLLVTIRTLMGIAEVRPEYFLAIIIGEISIIHNFFSVSFFSFSGSHIPLHACHVSKMVSHF